MKDTNLALEMAAVETLIVWEDLDIVRYEVINPVTGRKQALCLRDEEVKDGSVFMEAGVALEITDQVLTRTGCVL